MASKVAPPKNTGGGGFVFEDDVCSWLLAAMLAGEPVFGADSGPPVRLDFQTRPDGWFVDDVLVTTGVGTTRYRFALSVKSNAQFTATSAPSDFVAAAWEQWLHVGSKVFDASRDFIGLVIAPLSGAAASSVSGLTEKARENDPMFLPSRLATQNWASEDERKLFASFACPASLGSSTTDVDTARLLQRLQVIQRDFGSIVSESENLALELCRRAVRSHTAIDARSLWNVLHEVANELRPQAGSLSLNGLIDRMRSRVALADYPDYAGDWATLDARSAHEAALVRDSIANRVRLNRKEQVAEVIQSIAGEVQVALLGPSGVGKSALAKAAFEQRLSKGGRTLWFDAASLDRAADYGAFEATLRLQHPLAELLGRETGQEPVAIIDGLDRLYSDHSFRIVASLLRALNGGPQATRWRVLAVCQSQEWPRVVEELQRAGSPVARWHSHEGPALRPADLQPVREAVPKLARLLLQPQVGPLLTNLKLLDLVVRRLDGGTEIDASAWVGESSVAEWFWSAEIERGSDRLARGQFARGLAQAQADELTASVAVDTLDACSLDAAQSLTADQLLVQVPGDRLSFAHDLYGDWARLRLLLNHREDLANYLQQRYASPIWHRAIRLLGIHLLERENGVAEWKALLLSFQGGALTIVRDLLLEAPAFAMNAGPLLESIFPDLVAGDGLLQRLLTRFLAFATVPDEQMQIIAGAVGMDASAARATYRRPHWPYWLDVLAVLHAHRSEVVGTAPRETARIVEMWLKFASPGTIRRREAADLAVMLGQRAVDTRDDWRDRDEHDDRRRFYKCALLAAPDQPDEIVRIANVAAERVPRLARNAEAPKLQRRSRSMFGPGEMRGPWPDGPLTRVDDDFQHAVLDGPSIQHLFRVRPSVAREVMLATLIEAPHEVHWEEGRMTERELSLVHRDWHPNLFTHGPFLLCLREDFAEGLELIMRLVEFATDRSNEYATRDLLEWQAKAKAEGRTQAEIEEAVKGAPAQHLLLHDGTRELSFTGDAGSYGWGAGVSSQGYSPLPPDPVACALMALEKYFYMRIQEGQDVGNEVAATFARTRSVAPLGVLTDVGKRQPALFDGPLKPLLSAPELYAWEIAKMVHGRSHLMIGAFRRGQEFINLAQEFHGLQHRQRDLRHVAAERLLKTEEMQAFFSSVRGWWKRRRDAGEQLIDMAGQLELLLDPASYEVREHAAHGHVIVNVALERVQAERADELRDVNDRMLVAGFPMRCRTILDERQVQTNAQLDLLWHQWTRIRELATADAEPSHAGGPEGSGYINAIMGGIAVLLWHDEWLGQEAPRRPEVEGALESILNGERPESDVLSFEHDVSTWTWDCFAAESLVMLWARQPQDERWRRAVAEMVFAEKYATVRALFTKCAEMRAAIGEDFERIRRLAVDWAHVRERVHVLRSLKHMVPQVDEPVRERLQGMVEDWIEESILSFVAGTLGPLPDDWSHYEGANRFAEIDSLRPKWAEARLMDFKLVRCSHEWLPRPDEARNTEERASIVRFWRVALGVVVARAHADVKKGDHLYPHEDEAWVLENVAALVLQLMPSENPELFWAAIVDLQSEAHDWPERFLTALHRHALSSDRTPEAYPSLVREIARRALSEVNGERRWPWHEEVWDALLGIDYLVSDAWADRHADLVLGMWDVISLWMEKAPQEGRRLGRFARWLSKPAAASIRLRVLPWFLGQVGDGEKGFRRRDDDAEDDVAKLLNVIWEHDRGSLRALVDSFAAFQGLLAWLVERQNSLGLELQGRIARLA